MSGVVQDAINIEQTRYQWDGAQRLDKMLYNIKETIYPVKNIKWNIIYLWCMLQSMPGIGEMALNAQRLHNRLSAQIPQMTQYLPWACINYFVLHYDINKYLKDII